jgi:DNA-binding MarR family transcriptional regulator
MTSELNRVLEDAGVPSSTAFQALTVLFRADGPLPPSTIAGRMVVARPTLTGILKALEHRGLVARSGHPLDRRMQLIELTRTGRRTVAETLPLVHRFEAQLFGGLEARDVATLLGLLQVLAERLPIPGRG